MPLTGLDPKGALIVIDLQEGIVGMVDKGADVVAKSASLARAFRAKQLPVVLVNVAGRAPGRTQVSKPEFTFPPDWTEERSGAPRSIAICAKEL
jgi:nicotinamidase-related amidase